MGFDPWSPFGLDFRMEPYGRRRTCGGSGAARRAWSCIPSSWPWPCAAPDCCGQVGAWSTAPAACLPSRMRPWWRSSSALCHLWPLGHGLKASARGLGGRAEPAGAAHGRGLGGLAGGPRRQALQRLGGGGGCGRQAAARRLRAGGREGAPEVLAGDAPSQRHGRCALFYSILDLYY